jgi:hypothetical protein
MLRFDASKQIDFVGLKRTGPSSYRCKYPVVLAAWLRKQGYSDRPNDPGEIARLKNSKTEIWVRETGSVRVFGDGAPEAHYILERLIKG